MRINKRWIYLKNKLLEIGNKLYVTELRNDNYSLLHPDNTVVAQVRMSRNAAKAAAEGDDAEATAEA